MTTPASAALSIRKSYCRPMPRPLSLTALPYGTVWSLSLIHIYVAADPGAFIEYYHGPEDIPKEHRVFAYPKEAETARSILKAIREFQEAPPAPRKDCLLYTSRCV